MCLSMTIYSVKDNDRHDLRRDCEEFGASLYFIAEKAKITLHAELARINEFISLGLKYGLHEIIITK